MAAQGSTTIVDPTLATQKVTTSKSGAKVLLDVNCPTCSGGGGGSAGDGGYTIVIQGPGADGGVNWGVTVAQSALPTGASTEATLALIKAKTDNIDVALSTRTKPADQQHVIVDSSASVAVTGPLTDVQLRLTPVPVSGTVAATQSGAPWSVNQTQWNGVAVSTGSGASGTGTLRAILATDQTVIPVSDNGGSLTVDGTVSANASQTGTWSVRNQDGVGNALASATGAPAGSEQALIVRNIPSGTQAVSGTVTANAGTGPWPVTDNGGSLTMDTPQLPAALVGGRLDENVGAWLGSTAPTVGQKTMANSIPITLASNQSDVNVAVNSFAASLPVSNTAGTINRDGLAVSVGVVSTTCLAADPSRQGCSVCVAPNATANVHFRFSATAATVSYMQLVPGQCLSCNTGNRVYQEAITCIAASGTQTVYSMDID